MAIGMRGTGPSRADTPGPDLNRDGVAKAYGRWAPVYDVVFGPVFAQGRSLAAVAAEKIGGRVLEVGVGTGLSLQAYRRARAIVGIDISAPMLEKARRRVVRLGLKNVERLAVMDAEHLEFTDAAFDVVVAQYVVTAVPNPEAALDEFARVLRPGGEIIITTRIGAEAGLRRAVEHALAPITSRLGWRTEFAWSRYAAWAAKAPVEVVEHRALPPLGHFSLIRMRKRSA